MAQILSIDVYNFDSANNAFVSNKVRGIPVPFEVVDLRSTPLAPWQNSGKFIYSKIIYAVGGIHKEALVAEVISSIITRANT